MSETSLPILRQQKVRLPIEAHALDQAMACVHCGLCLPVCPTYTTTHHEADSPRGRIQLMRALAEGEIGPTASVVRHLDLCLDCRACETACPSGVSYHLLIEETRVRLAELPRPPERRKSHGLLSWLVRRVFTRPGRLKMMLLPARILQKLGLYGLVRRLGVARLLPDTLQKLERMLPPDGPMWPRKLPEYLAAGTTPARKRVLFFSGCVGSVLFQEVNRKAIELLAAGGCEVFVPPAQVCCGAIHHHNGDHAGACELSRANLSVFMPPDGRPFDYITTAIGGCGAMLREYDDLLKGDSRAEQFAGKVRDISEVLAELSLPPARRRIEQTAAYHDACHLAHAQQVTTCPRMLLAKIPGLKVIVLAESDMCCGAAGTYNLTQPVMAGQLADRKLSHLLATGAHFCVTGNVGCAMHIQSEAAARGLKIKVVHPVELLYEAILG